MTKKQQRAIDELWASNLIMMADPDSLGCLSVADAEAIMNEMHKVARYLARGRNKRHTLRAIINQVLTDAIKKEPRKETTKEIGERIRKRCNPNSGNAGYGHGPFETS
jgi:hypothetical protein